MASLLTQLLILHESEYQSLEGLYVLESHGNSQNNFFFKHMANRKSSFLFKT